MRGKLEVLWAVLDGGAPFWRPFCMPSGDDRRLVQPPEGGGDPLAQLPEHHGLGVEKLPMF